MNDNQITIFLYFYSTLAQVCAAIIGIAGFFLLFSFQYIHEKIYNSAKLLYSHDFSVKDPELNKICKEFSESCLTKSINGIAEVFRVYQSCKIIVEKRKTNYIIDQNIKAFQRIYNKRKKLLDLFSITFLFALFAIGLSLFFIYGLNDIKSFEINTFFAIIVFISGLISLYLNFRIILLSISN